MFHELADNVYARHIIDTHNGPSVIEFNGIHDVTSRVESLGF